jgi:hypothetical protein
MAPLGDKPWVSAPGPLFPTHALYIIPAQSLAQDANGLPTGTPPAPVLVTNPSGTAPRVVLGAKLVPSVGGAMVSLGDAWVSNLSQIGWTRTQLLGAQFHIGSPSGDLYQVMGGTLEEAGPATWILALSNMSQPRP